MKKIVSVFITFIFISTLVLGVINSIKAETKVTSNKQLAAIFPFPPPMPKKKDD